ncbi:3-mercaptopyruvate sulfurtransferase [Caulobacter mirabilis]|uniref:Sulfurtransferase n=1 Tax=Caulobacter mirabilis TaxID=69666 RepID=A0A2D2AXS1_9CAUL|nr:3-mercaptopyruvate sulfurtransferase [Caulobacter mirabilis]ATQ42819.1 3-mercaptopyruvate sulfurtransferase [Caulobacter mirabilis]
MADPIVTTAWLADHLGAPDVRIVDASWYFPQEERDARAEFELAHVPGAVFFDIDEISDETSSLPHMLPSPVKFASRVRRLGLGDGAKIVVYDQLGLRSAARVWWTFRVMGHEDVAVLDGGLPKWIAEGRPIEDGPAAPRDRHFTARYSNDLVRDLNQVKRALDGGTAQLVDARPAARFAGEAPEPREGLRGGHMPGAANVPSSALLAPDGTLKTPEQLTDLFEKAGVDLKKPIITTCGSGITAAMLSLALARVGRDRVPVYDGSWAEWGAREDTAIVTG